MLQKYKETFIQSSFSHCNSNMSWQNKIKYIMLAEICQWDIKNIDNANTKKDFLFELCISLTRNSLRCGGTKLYLIILRKLSEDEWKESFGEVLKSIINLWESGEQ